MKELRLFALHDDMMNDFNQFIADVGQDAIVRRHEMRVTIGWWDIYWDMGRDVMSRHCGREYNRIQADCYIDSEDLRYACGRVRSPDGTPTEPPMLFYRYPHNFHW